MQTKRQLLLPLLAAATAMMVSPYAGATAYNSPSSVAGSTVINLAAPVALIAGDTASFDSGAASLAGTYTINTGGTVTVKAGASVTVAAAAPVFTTGAGANPMAINISGTVTANAGSNTAVDGGLWASGGANNINVSVLAGGVLVGDIIPGDASAASATNIVVNGSWTGNLPTAAANSTANTSSLTVSGPNAIVTARTAAGINTPTQAVASPGYTIKMNQGGKITSNITVTTPATSRLTMNVDTGASVITGNVVGGAAGNSALSLGAVDGANSASLTVTGTFDGLKINQLVPGALQFNGKVGNANATGAVVLSAGTTLFKDTAVTGAATFNGTNQATFNSDFTSGAITMANNAVVSVAGNLLTANTITMSDASRLTVTGNAANLTTFTSQGGSGAAATFNGAFTLTGAATVGANTSLTVKGVYTQGAASTNAGTLALGGTGAVIGGGNLTTNAGGLTTFGSTDNSGTVATAISGANSIIAAGGQTTLYKGTTIAAATTLSATGGIITIREGIIVPGTISSTGGYVEFYPTSGTNAVNAPGAAGKYRIRGTDVNGTKTQVLFSGGNYGPNNSATTSFIFDDSMNYGQLNVSNGNIAFGTSMVNVHHTGGYVTPGVYTIATASGTLDTTGTVIYSSASMQAGTLSFATTFDATNKVVKVTVTRPKALNTFASDTNTQALLASVNALPSIAVFQTASAGQRAILNSIESTVAANATNPGAIATALQGFMPNVSSLASARRVVQTATTTLAGRLDAVAYDINTPQAYVAGSNHSDSVWMRGTYNRTNQKLDTASNYNGYTANQLGAMIGFDTMRFSHATLGLGLGYSQANSKDRLNVNSKNQVKSYQVMPYGSFTFGDRSTRGFMDWFVGYTYNSITGTRVVGSNLGTNSYSYNMSIFSAKGSYGLDRVINRNLTLTPFVSALVSYQPSVTYTESGYAAITNQNNSRFGLEFELGLKGVVRPDAGSKANTRLIFRAMGVWSALNNNLKSTSTLIGTQSFTYSVTQQKFGARAGMSGVFEVLTDLDLELSYDIEARSKYLSHTGLVEFKYHF